MNQNRRSFFKTLAAIPLAIVGVKVAKEVIPVYHPAYITHDFCLDSVTEWQKEILMGYHVAWLQDEHRKLLLESSIAKIFSTDLMRELAQVGLQLFGLYSQLAEDAELAPLQGHLIHMAMWDIGLSIGAGTTEIQKNTIATAGLRLPRG